MIYVTWLVGWVGEVRMSLGSWRWESRSGAITADWFSW